MRPALAALGVVSAPLCAMLGQQTPAVVLTGVVRDTSGFALDAEVSILTLKRLVIADSSGRFRMGDLKRGRYVVSARRLGFYSQSKTVVVTDTGASVAFRLVPLSLRLPPIVKVAKRGGLSGVIGDTAFAPVDGADVQVLSTIRRAKSDTLGHFFIDVPPGKWMVKVSRKGFATQVASVTIAPDSGREMFVWLRQADEGSIHKEEFSLREMSERIVWGGLNCGGAKGRSMCSQRPEYITREDIAKSGFTEGVQIATKGAYQTVDPWCQATVMNTRLKRELWLIGAEEIEWMEVYANRRESYAITGDLARNGGRASKAPAFARDNCPTIMIWLRK
jgi:hypothetical protein